MKITVTDIIATKAKLQKYLSNVPYVFSLAYVENCADVNNGLLAVHCWIAPPAELAV